MLSVAVQLCKALVDVAAQSMQGNDGVGSLHTTLVCCELSQLLIQGMLPRDSLLYQIPYLTTSIIDQCAKVTITDDEGNASAVDSVLDILDMEDDVRESCLASVLPHMSEIASFCNGYPSMSLKYDIKHPKGQTSISAGDTFSLTVHAERDQDEDSDEEEEEEEAEVGDNANTPPVLSRFPVPHQEEWWLIIGDVKNDKLMGIKRLQIPKKGAVKKKLKITVPDNAGGGGEGFQLKMYLVCDSYRGCDEERDVLIPLQ